MPITRNSIQMVRNEQITRLEQTAQDAIHIYQHDVAAGGEPPFPNWTNDMMFVLKLVDAMAEALQLAHEALSHSTPIMASFPAPMKQHYDAKFAAARALQIVGIA